MRLEEDVTSMSHRVTCIKSEQNKKHLVIEVLLLVTLAYPSRQNARVDSTVQKDKVRVVVFFGSIDYDHTYTGTRWCARGVLRLVRGERFG